MSAENSKLFRFGMFGDGPGDDGSGPFYCDNSRGNSPGLDPFSFRGGIGSPVLAINGFANNSVDIGLQAAKPADDGAIKFSFGDVVNLDAWANAGATGSVTSSAASQGVVTVTHNMLSGTYTASLSIDVSAYIAADHATVTMQITDSVQLALSGKGYVGASLNETSAAGGTVVAMTPSGGSAGGSGCGTFDLAQFAASVLHTGSDSISFLASAPGESLHVLGSSVLTIDATADVAGLFGPQISHFSETDRSQLGLDASSSQGYCSPYLVQDPNAGAVGPIHTT